MFAKRIPNTNLSCHQHRRRMENGSEHVVTSCVMDKSLLSIRLPPPLPIDLNCPEFSR